MSPRFSSWVAALVLALSSGACGGSSGGSKPEASPTPAEVSPLAVRRMVGAYWYPHWGDPTNAAPRLAWSQAVLTPVLGQYDANDSKVVDQHIKMAVEHGVTLLVVSLYETRIQGLLGSRFLPFVKFTFSVNLEDYGGFRDPHNLPAVLDWMRGLGFTRPSYFRVEGKPVFVVGDVNLLTEQIPVEELGAAFDAGRSYYRARYGEDLFIVGQWNPGSMSKDSRNVPIVTTTDVTLASHLDAATPYSFPDAGGQWHLVASGGNELVAPYDDMAALFPEANDRFASAMHGRGVRFIPTATPGESNTLLYRNGLDGWLIIRTGATPAKFGGLLDSLRGCMDPDLNLLLVEAWNEFSEGSVVEPTVEFGYQHLDEIARFAAQP